MSNTTVINIHTMTIYRDITNKFQSFNTQWFVEALERNLTCSLLLLVNIWILKPYEFIQFEIITNLFYIILEVLDPPKASQPLIDNINRYHFLLFGTFESQRGPITSIFMLDSYWNITLWTFWTQVKQNRSHVNWHFHKYKI